MNGILYNLKEKKRKKIKVDRKTNHSKEMQNRYLNEIRFRKSVATMCLAKDLTPTKHKMNDILGSSPRIQELLSKFGV